MPLAAAATVASIVVPRAFADEEVAPVVEKIVLGPPPTDWGLKMTYYDDCQKVDHHHLHHHICCHRYFAA